MKILAFSDVHCGRAACEALVAAAAEADLVIGAGDFARRREGLADMMASRGSVGPVEIRNTIERVQPRLMVCGHVHDCWGERGNIGQTKVANLGPSINWIELEL